MFGDDRQSRGEKVPLAEFRATHSIRSAVLDRFVNMGILNNRTLGRWSAADNSFPGTYLISPALRGRNSESSGMQMISIRPMTSASK